MHGDAAWTNTRQSFRCISLKKSTEAALWRLRCWGGVGGGWGGIVLAVQSPWRSLQVLQGQFCRDKRLERPRHHRGSPLGVLRILLLAAQRVVDEWHTGVGRCRRFSNASLSAQQPLISSVSETRTHEILAIQRVCLKTHSLCLSGLFPRFLQPFGLDTPDPQCYLTICLMWVADTKIVGDIMELHERLQARSLATSAFIKFIYN